MLAGPGGEDGAEDQVELHDGQVQVHRLELLRQAGILHLEVPAEERDIKSDRVQKGFSKELQLLPRDMEVALLQATSFSPLKTWIATFRSSPLLTRDFPHSEA